MTSRGGKPRTTLKDIIMANGIKPGYKTSEAWAGSAVAGIILWADKLVDIPEIVASDPGLMTTIVVAKFAALTILAVVYMLTRGRVKESASINGN